MAQGGTRTVAIHQVTEGRRQLREVRHPLAAELLVAEMAGELPPDVADAVRQHVSVCESCGVRAQALAAPYEAIASLGEQPVPYVPDLRRTVRQRLAATPLRVQVWQTARQFGGGTLAAVLAIVAILLVVGLSIANGLVHTPLVLGRSQNGVAAPPAAGAGAVLYAQTAKMLDVRDSTGHSWSVAEVIVVDEHTGRVLRSLPAGATNLHLAAAGEAPKAIALAADGTTIFELTSVQGGGQALIALDTSTGTVNWISTLALPGGHALGAGTRATALAVSPDGQTVYAGLTSNTAAASGPRVLVVDAASGSVSAALAPTLPGSAPLAAAPGAVSDLPGPSTATFTPAPGTRPTLAAGGAIALSPDGNWLYDVVVYTDGAGSQTAIVRAFGAATGAPAYTLALRGDFRLAALAASPSATTPVLYLATGGAAGQAYMLSSSATGLTLVGQAALDGPYARPGARLTGQIAVSPTADGTQAYVSADVSASDASIAAHDIWLVDSSSATVITHRVPFLGAGQVLANWSGGTSGRTFELIGGAVYLVPPSLTPANNPVTWLRLADGQPVTALIGTGPA